MPPFASANGLAAEPMAPSDPLDVLREAAELAKRMAGEAETTVEQRMRARMALSQQAAKLKALGTDAALAVLGAVETQHAAADTEVRTLVGITSQLSSLHEDLLPLADELGKAAGQQEELEALTQQSQTLMEKLTDTERELRAAQMKIKLVEAEAEQSKTNLAVANQSKGEVTARAGDMLNQLNQQQGRVRELEQHVASLKQQLQAASVAASAAAPNADEAEAVDDSVDVEIDDSFGEGPLPDTGEFRHNPLITASPKLAKEKYAGRASVRIRELLLEEPHSFNELVDLTGLPRAEVADCVESFVALGVASVDDS